MDNKKSAVLGEHHSTARARLVKMILFKLLVDNNLNNCFRCNQKIDAIKDLSIEHKKAWLNSGNPKELFFDVNNVAFSHLDCNCGNKLYPNGRPSENRPIKKGHFRKLSDDQIREIRNIKGLTYREIAPKYNVSHQTIEGIIKRRWYVDV